MPSNKRAHSYDKSSAKQKRPRPANPDLDRLERKGMEGLIQCAQVDPGALTSRDLLQLQRTIGNQAANRLLPGTLQRQPIQKNENNTGLPDDLKAGVESLSGMPMDDVKVHYNSSQPDQLQAWAYTQGTEIHLGPGQEEYLPHEAWHVVQQKQGRVAPTTALKDKKVNSDEGLELEAEAMGSRALARPGEQSAEASSPVQRQADEQSNTGGNSGTSSGVIQLGKKAHILAGAAIGTIVPVIGTIIGGYIGYRIYKKKKQQQAAATAGPTTLTTVNPPSSDVVGRMDTMSDDELFSMEREVERVRPKRTIKRGNVPVRKEPESGPLAEMNPEELKGFIEGVKDLILSKKYKEAYDLLTSRDKARELGINLILDNQFVSGFDADEPDAIINGIATSNMSFAGERKIRLRTVTIAGKVFTGVSDHPALSEAVLPMYLEEYMHQYQGNTKSFFSETTSKFQSQHKPSTTDFDPPDYDEVDVMAKLHEWGFDVEKIDYVKRYQEREDYWQWLQEQREKV